jgi:hypothetical protein
LKRFLALKQEIEMSMNENGEVVAELCDNKWLWDLIPTTMTHDLHTKLQGQQILISDMSVKAF